MIPAEAVEAAAKALRVVECGDSPYYCSGAETRGI